MLSLPLLVVPILIVWAVVRAVRGHQGEHGERDQAASVRRFFVYAMLFGTMIIVAIGVADFGRELVAVATTANRPRNNTVLARSLSFLIVGTPAFLLLVRFVLRRLVDPIEQRSASWFLYINVALLTTLIVSIVSAHQLLTGAFGAHRFAWDDLWVCGVWSAMWAFHWFWLLRNHSPVSDLHLALGSIAGAGMFAVGLGGLVGSSGGRIYLHLAHSVRPSESGVALREWTATLVVGAVVWAWYWLTHYRSATRTTLWHVVVVPVGSLGGLVTAITSAAVLGFQSLVWFFGQHGATTWSTHFTFLPNAASAFLVGIAAWSYHRWEFGRVGVPQRSDPLRSYDYLASAAGLTAAIVGIVLAVVAFLEAVTPAPRTGPRNSPNRTIAAITLLSIGLPLWALFWSRIKRALAAHRAEELRSPVRRIYVIALFGIGSVITIGGLIAVLWGSLQDLLDGKLGGTTIRDIRVGIALVVAVAGAAWFHFNVFRSERHEYAPVKAATPVMHKQVVLVATNGDDVAQRLASGGTTVIRWHRTDQSLPPPVDPDDVASRVFAVAADRVLVLLGADGLTVVPYEDELSAVRPASPGSTGTGYRDTSPAH
jgi:uncharacterized membrane protein YidH (DUF202 family)